MTLRSGAARLFVTIGRWWVTTRSGLLGLVVLGALTVAVSATWYAPSPSNTDRLSIAVAPLEQDDDGTHTELINEILREFPDIQIARVNRPVAQSLARLDEAESAAHEEARSRLQSAGADVLVWGTVVKNSAQPRLKLSWTPTPDLGIERSFGKYEVVEPLDLPPLHRDDLTDVLRLLVATYALDLDGMDARAAADAFFPFLLPVFDMLARPTEDAWSADAGARIARVGATALFRYAEQTSQSPLLEDAVTVYRDVLAAYPREHRPVEWATAQSRLAAVLAALGERSLDTERLEEAEAMFRAALTEPHGAPLERATTQMRLGNVLTTLGTMKEPTSATRLEEAVTAYRAALTDEARQHMSLSWAATQNNLGNALKALGALKADTTMIEDAVAAYRAALTVETRKRMPLQWATVQSNLGSALARLGEARSDPARLQEAVRAYREALKERPRAQMPMTWAATQHNLGNALRVLGQIESSTAQLEKAADAYTAALVEFTRAKSEPHIETTKRNLERTMKSLDERKKS